MADSKKYNGSTWEHSLRKLGTSTDTITTLPADLYADGNNATVGISGNMSQTGIPTHDNPIMPQGTGERTGNLFDGVYSNISGTIRYRPIFVGDGTFTLSTTTPYDSSVANVFLLSGNVSSGASTPGNGAWKNHNVTAQSVDGYVTIAYRHYSGTTSPVDCQTMLNTGSQSLPYEPYGYKIPISSANTTTPVYLGEVQSTRQIKRLVLTGEEGWTVETGKTYVLEDVEQTKTGYTDAICSHYTLATSYNTVTTTNNTFALSKRPALFIHDDNYSSTTAFKTYLQQQYAAGTPVCVWYVLATPQTAVVNEPLRKIGNYADEVSDITIPTITGADSFDVLTTLKPSEVSLAYTGWHDATVEEWDGSQWQ